jgi:hypothetical protein
MSLLSGNDLNVIVCMLAAVVVVVEEVFVGVVAL